MLSALYDAHAKQNNYRAQQENREDRIREAQQILTKRLTTLETDIERSKRAIETVALQATFLKKASSTELLYSPLQQQYQDALMTLQISFIKRERTLLEGQTSISSVMIEKALTEFESALHQELAPYRQLPNFETVSLKLLLSVLEEKQTALEKQYTQQLEEKKHAQVELEATNKALLQHQETLSKRINLSQGSEQYFFEACQSGDLQKVQQWLEAKPVKQRAQHLATLDEQGQTALHYACLRAHLSVVRYLLKQGANPKQPDGNGAYVIHAAAVGGNPLLLEQLCAYEIDIQALDKHQQNALHIASWHGHHSAVVWLVGQGISVNATTDVKRYQRTPLHVAAAQGHTPIVKYLLSQGANPRSLNTNQEPPLFEAIFNQHWKTVEAFLEAGISLTHPEQERLLPTLKPPAALGFSQLLDAEQKRITGFLKRRLSQSQP